jgi:hypothetical protein
MVRLLCDVNGRERVMRREVFGNPPSLAQECVTAFVSRKPTEAATTEIHNKNSIKPDHLPIADACFSVHARVFF